MYITRELQAICLFLLATPVALVTPPVIASIFTANVTETIDKSETELTTIYADYTNLKYKIVNHATKYTYIYRYDEVSGVLLGDRCS